MANSFFGPPGQITTAVRPIQTQKKHRGEDAMRFLAAMAVLGSLILTGCHSTSDPEIQGYMVDRNGFPIREQSIDLLDPSGAIVCQAKTNRFGDFSLKVTTPGRFCIDARRAGFEDFTAEFSFSGGSKDLGGLVMQNRSRIAVHSFYPPSLADMMCESERIARRQFTVYLPPSYDVEPDRQYPAIYILHGNGHFHLSYFLPVARLGRGLNLQSAMDELIAQGLIPEMILVVPNGALPWDWVGSIFSGSFFVDSSVNGAFETYVSQDLIECVETNRDNCLWDGRDEGYRLIPSGASRGVHGICMGGIGAMNMALHCPGRFTAVASNIGPVSFDQFIHPFMDGVEPLLNKLRFDPDFLVFLVERMKAVYMALDPEHYPDNEFPVWFGPMGHMHMTYVTDPENPSGPPVELWSNFYLDNDPYTFLSEHPEAAEGLSFYLDCGSGDDRQLYDNNAAFSALLEKLGLPPSLDLGPDNRHFFEIYPSKHHVDEEVKERVMMALTFLARHLEVEW